MRDSRSKRRQTIRWGGSWAMVISLVVAMTGGILSAGFLQPASATLPGSTFNGLDKVVDAGVTDITDPIQGADTSNYSNGSSEDDICPGVQTGTAPNADDLDHFYFGTESNASGVFLYLAWHRISAVGDKTIDFELNQSSALAPGCANGVTPARTAGDVLISFDFNGSGTVTLNRRLWVGTSSVGAWSAPTTLVTGEEASVDATGAFGEMVINGTVSGLFAPNTCSNFASAYAKSHASNSFNSQLKDFTNGVTRTISSCGSVVITKTDDAVPAQPVNGAVFGLFTDVAGVIGTAVPGKTCTTVAGTCTISDISPAGTYWVKETTTPAGYVTAADQKVTVNTAAVPLTFVNNRKPATINITKVDDDVPPKAVNGAVFGLFTDVAGVIGTAVSGKTCTTAGAGVCSITNILPPGTYWVKETSTPAGYVTAASQKVTVGLDGTANLTFVNVRQAGAIGLTKTVNGQHPTQAAPLVVEAGSTLNYVVTVTNTGAQLLTITQLTDSLKASLPSTCTQGIGSTLVSGASFTCSYTAVADKAANNVAGVTATDVLGRTVTASDQTFVAPIHPAISLTKSGPTFGHVGDVVTYELKVVNSGDVGLANVVPSDAKCSSAPALKTKAGGNQDAVLELGETWTYTCTHTVTAADGNSFVNNASVGAIDPLGTAVAATATHTMTILHPALSVVKTANPVSGTPGDSVTFTYVTTNTGDTDLTNVTVDDDVLGGVAVIPTLAKGASNTVTKTMTLTATSPLVNVATATGTDPTGFRVSASDDARISIVLGEVLVAPAVLAAPELPRTGADVADQVFLALSLIGLGAAILLVFPARRRRTTA